MDRRSSCLQLRSREKTKGASYIRRSVIGLTAIRFIENLPGIQNSHSMSSPAKRFLRQHQDRSERGPSDPQFGREDRARLSRYKRQWDDTRARLQTIVSDAPGRL